MGVVYRAYDPDLRRAVALKVLPEGSTSADAPLRLFNEARAAARLRHPNIVGIHDVGVSDGQHYIAMDFVEGTTLRDSTLPQRRRLEILVDVARAIQFAHSQGIVHRDLKPDNIMIDRAGRAVVTDFGLARVAGASLALTRPGDMVGTPLYMSPEQVRGETAGPHSDVWALGVILFETLTGTPPFTGESMEEICLKIVADDTPRPSARRADVAQDLETVAMKALRPEPHLRYISAGGFADDLDHALRGEPIAARPPSLFERWARRVRHHRAVAALAVGVGVAVLAGAYFAWAGRHVQSQLAETLRNIDAVAQQAVDSYENSLMGPASPPGEERAKMQRTLGLLEQLRRRSPDIHESLITMGRVHAKLGRTDRALACLDEAIEKLGARATGDAYLERALARSALLLDARVVREAIMVNGWPRRCAPTVEAVRADLAEARRLGTRTEQARMVYAEMLEALVRLDVAAFQQAADRFASASGPRTLQADMHRLVGFRMIFSGQATGSMQQFEIAASIKRSDPAILLNAAAMCCVVAGVALGRAQQYVRDALEVDANAAEVRIVEAMIWSQVASLKLGRSEDPAEACNEGRRAVQAARLAGPADPTPDALLCGIEFVWARWLQARDEPFDAALADAVAAADRALAIEPENVQARFNRALTLGIFPDETRREEALRDYHRLLASAPDHAAALCERARLRLRVAEKSGRGTEAGRAALDNALADADRAVASPLRRAESHEVRAQVLLERSWHAADQGVEDLRAAEKSCVASLEADPTSATAHLLLATVHRREWGLSRRPELLESAMQDAHRATELAPKYALAHMMLALFLADGGRFGEAVASAERAIAIQPSYRTRFGEQVEDWRRKR